MAAGDVQTALAVLCVMQSNGPKPDDASTRSIVAYLRADPTRPQEAFDMLRTLAEEECREVPSAAVNAVIEASAESGQFAQAIEQYKQLHSVCSSGPSVHTFNVIFKSCRREKRKDVAMFLAAEMVESKVRPDALTYDRLILVCLEDYVAGTNVARTHDTDPTGKDGRHYASDEEKGLADAWQYYGEMNSQGFECRAGTYRALAMELARRRRDDSRVTMVLEDMARAGHDTLPVRARIADIHKARMESARTTGRGD